MLFVIINDIDAFVIVWVFFFLMNVTILFPIPPTEWSFGYFQKVLWTNVFQMPTMNYLAAPDISVQFVEHRWYTIGFLAGTFAISWLYEFMCLRVSAVYKKRRNNANSSLMYKRL